MTPLRGPSSHAPAVPVRPPAVAGLFYPEEPVVLRREISGLLDRARSRRTGAGLVALVSPHAGYRFSGATAAEAYRQLQGRSIGTVVIVSPSHREYFPGISVFDGPAYRTPLGELSVNGAMRDALVRNDAYITASSDGHRTEHAIEVQLPFLQSVLATTPSILPIVMGDQRRELCEHLGRRLASVLARTDSIMVASTDLSHYHPYADAEALDREAIRSIESFDDQRLMDDLEAERVEACGGGPTVAVLIAARLLGARRVEILDHCNSGDTSGDRRSVVGYLSAAITR